MGVAHRDLKPENLLLKSKETTWVKLSDFGFAKEAHKGLTTPK
jgi:serine/threonine protein kinase